MNTVDHLASKREIFPSRVSEDATLSPCQFKGGNASVMHLQLGCAAPKWLQKSNHVVLTRDFQLLTFPLRTDDDLQMFIAAASRPSIV